MYLDQTLCGFAPALEHVGKLFMLSGYDPFLVRPLLVTKVKDGDVRSLAGVDWIAESSLAYFILSFHGIELGTSNLPGPHNITAF